jgi:aromatic ring-opening dioxygenase LigB subunit
MVGRPKQVAYIDETIKFAVADSSTCVNFDKINGMNSTIILKMAVIIFLHFIAYAEVIILLNTIIKNLTEFQNKFTIAEIPF